MKSKFLTICFSAIPGLGHMYLGLMNRGIQFMLVAGVSILFIIFSRLEPFIIFLPIIWFYSLFDALQQHQLIKDGIFEDTSLPFWNKMYFSHKWVAYFLIGIGAYILLEKLLQMVGRYLGNYYSILFDFRSFIVATVFIFIGYRLLLLKKKADNRYEVEYNEGGESSNEK